MDTSLERLGHYIVSRRLALGFRNRTDLANSLQFTVRTLADIEHGVRKASPGTYAIWKKSFPGHPAASTPSSRAESPTSWWSSYAGPRPIPGPTPPPTLSPASPPKSSCWNCDGASSRPARHARPGTTGTASTLAATGPTTASSTLDTGHCPLLLNAEPPARRDPQRWRTYEPEL